MSSASYRAAASNRHEAWQAPQKHGELAWLKYMRMWWNGLHASYRATASNRHEAWQAPQEYGELAWLKYMRTWWNW